MSNTTLTDREKALQWWDDLPVEYKREKYSSLKKGYGGYKTILPSEIESIWRKEKFPTASSVESGEYSSWDKSKIVNYWNADKAALKEIGGKLTEMEKVKDDLQACLESIVKEWTGEGKYKELPELKFSTVNDECIEYWSPGGKIINSESIAKAIESLQKANPHYKP